MRNGSNYQISVAKRQDGDGLVRHTLVTFRELGLSHISTNAAMGIALK